MGNSQVKTPLLQNEAVIVRQMCTLFKGMRDSGYIVLTSMRLIWEKGGAMNIAGKGLLSLASSNKDIVIPLEDITNISEFKALSAAGIEVTTKNNEQYKFALNSPIPLDKKPQKSRDLILEYVRRFKNQK